MPGVILSKKNHIVYKYVYIPGSVKAFDFSFRKLNEVPYFCIKSNMQNKQQFISGCAEQCAILLQYLKL